MASRVLSIWIYGGLRRMDLKAIVFTRGGCFCVDGGVISFGYLHSGGGLPNLGIDLDLLHAVLVVVVVAGLILIESGYVVRGKG